MDDRKGTLKSMAKKLAEEPIPSVEEMMTGALNSIKGKSKEALFIPNVGVNPNLNMEIRFSIMMNFYFNSIKYVSIGEDKEELFNVYRLFDKHNPYIVEYSIYNKKDIFRVYGVESDKLLAFCTSIQSVVRFICEKQNLNYEQYYRPTGTLSQLQKKLGRE